MCSSISIALSLHNKTRIIAFVSIAMKPIITQSPSIHSPVPPSIRVGRLRRAWIWLRRISYCRGFGVQSPSAYRFIRYVVNEHYPYYAYGDLRKTYPDLQGADLKLMRFYLRLANYCQADTFVDAGGIMPDILPDFLSAGCRKTRVTTAIDSAGFIRLLRIGTAHDHDWVDHVLNRTGQDTVIIVEQIGLRPELRDVWLRLQADPRVSVSFDLYYCGVAFFDTARHKCNYVVNF